MTSTWKPGEEALRGREVRLQTITVIIGLAILLATALTAWSAARSAEAASESVKGSQRANERAAAEARYAAAVQALGGNLAVQRVAGFTMLRRNIEDRMVAADDDKARTDALHLYDTSLDVFENYLKFPPASQGEFEPQGQSGTSSADAATKEQFGSVARPQDQFYAAAQFRYLLAADDQKLVRSLDPSYSIAVDLAHAPLYGQSWPNIDFSWLGSKYLLGIDLRGANLSGSKWGDATLQSAHLQCANLASNSVTTDLRNAHLRGAKLMHANLRGADLRGADLSGADLTGAQVQGAMFDGAIFDSTTVTVNLVGRGSGNPRVSGHDESPTDAFNLDGCLTTGYARE